MLDKRVTIRDVLIAHLVLAVVGAIASIPLTFEETVIIGLGIGASLGYWMPLKNL